MACGATIPVALNDHANRDRHRVVLYEFRERTSPTVALLEAQAADMYLSAARDVKAYTSLFDRLMGESLDPAESVKYLKSQARLIRRSSGTRKVGR